MMYIYINLYVLIDVCIYFLDNQKAVCVCVYAYQNLCGCTSKGSQVSSGKCNIGQLRDDRCVGERWRRTVQLAHLSPAVAPEKCAESHAILNTS